MHARISTLCATFEFWAFLTWYPYYMRRISHILAILVLCVFFGTGQANAQIAVPEALTLAVSPSFPEAGEEYTLTLKTFDLPAPIRDINWFVNGTLSENNSGKAEITLVANSVASTIKARVILSNGTVLEESYAFNPYRVDLIVSAETTVPAFYKGRPLPSSGSAITAKALIFNNGVQIGDSYSYVWKVNGKVQNGGAKTSDNSLSFATNFEKTVSLSVDIYNSNGSRIASEVKTIPIVDPELYFYERNLLRGLSTTIMPDPYTFIGEEVSIRGEAYFMDSDLFTDDGFTEWRINGQGIEASSEDGQEVTLRKESTNGSSRLSFHIRNMRQLLQGIEDTITIRF
jgi:hypothetical protein